MRLNALAVSTGDIVKASTGVFYIDVFTTSSGTYEYRWTSTGNVAQTDEAWFFVRPRRVVT